MIVLFTLVSLLAAALLFAIEPMAAKMALPLLGGGAGVWTTCMLFFQTGLLAGYGWAHAIGRLPSIRAQVALHGALAAAGLLVLPPAIAAAAVPPVDSSPVPWLFRTLALSVGLPLAALAATGPIVQRWLAATGHVRAADPYFLYAASNAGSFAGLVAYPFVLERTLPLKAAAPGWSQATVWSIAFAVLVALIVASGVWASLRPGPARAAGDVAGEAPSPADRARWIALAFVPSATMLGVTHYLTSDVAAVPLFWIVPLGLYLLTFVIAFSPRVRLPMPALGVGLAASILAVGAEFRGGTRVFGLGVFAIHLAALVCVGLLGHGRLAASRPDRRRLTEYYLWIAVGGCLGGVFDAIVAPLVFDTIAEYPLALGLAAFLIPRPRANPRVRNAAAIGLAAVLAVTWTSTRTSWSALHRERTFYGVHRVVATSGPPFSVVDSGGQTRTASRAMHVLIDGVTRHGSQSTDLRGRLTPTTYYHPSGPLGDIMRGIHARGSITEVGLIGLGAGTAAAYGEAGERFTYFEIDPAIARIARDPALFTYIGDSRAAVAIVLGDGRRRIAETSDGRFDLIVLDAFSSDAIPVHLLTEEAMRLYLSKLKPGGVVAVHLTNGYLSLDPVVAALAARLRVPAAIKRDDLRTPEQAFEGKDASTWAVIARDASDPLPVSENAGWARTRPAAGETHDEFLWTDARSNVVGLLRRR